MLLVQPANILVLEASLLALISAAQNVPNAIPELTRGDEALIA